MRNYRYYHPLKSFPIRFFYWIYSFLFDLVDLIILRELKLCHLAPPSLCFGGSTMPRDIAFRKIV